MLRFEKMTYFPALLRFRKAATKQNDNSSFSANFPVDLVRFGVVNPFPR